MSCVGRNGPVQTHVRTTDQMRIGDTRLRNERSVVGEHSAVTLAKQKSWSMSTATAPPVIREAVEITKHPHAFEGEDGCRLRKPWFHLFFPRPPTQPPTSLNMTKPSSP